MGKTIEIKKGRRTIASIEKYGDVFKSRCAFFKGQCLEFEYDTLERAINKTIQFLISVNYDFDTDVKDFKEQLKGILE